MIGDFRVTETSRLSHCIHSIRAIIGSLDTLVDIGAPAEKEVIQ